MFRGHQGVESFWREFWSAFETVEIEIHELMPVGRSVVVPNTAHMRGREGIEVVANSTFVFTVENGLQTRVDAPRASGGPRRRRAVEVGDVEENVDALRRSTKAFNDGDLDRALELWDPDAVLRAAWEPT